MASFFFSGDLWRNFLVQRYAKHSWGGQSRVKWPSHNLALAPCTSVCRAFHLSTSTLSCDSYPLPCHVPGLDSLLGLSLITHNLLRLTLSPLDLSLWCRFSGSLDLRISIQDSEVAAPSSLPALLPSFSCSLSLRLML